MPSVCNWCSQNTGNARMVYGQGNLISYFFQSAVFQRYSYKGGQHDDMNLTSLYIVKLEVVFWEKHMSSPIIIPYVFNIRSEPLTFPITSIIVKATGYSLILKYQLVCIATQDTHGVSQWGSQLVISFTDWTLRPTAYYVLNSEQFLPKAKWSSLHQIKNLFAFGLWSLCGSFREKSL